VNDFGVSVHSAGWGGFLVSTVGNPSEGGFSSSKDGFKVYGAEGNGLFVGHADEDGVHVHSAGRYAGYFGGDTRVTEDLQVAGNINSAGMVGIGTDTPDYAFDVRGDKIHLINTHPTLGERWIAMRGNGGALDIQFEGANLGIQSTTDGEHICLNPSRASNVGICTWGPTQKLDVNGNARFRSVASGAYDRPLNLTSDGTLTTATSDGRLKTNIEPIEDSLAIVDKLHGVRFNWKENPAGERKIGLIAQDVEKVLPELTFTNPSDGYLGVNYAELSAVLVEAVKTQQQTIEDLQRQLASLQKAVQTLSARQSHSDKSTLLSANIK